jgi:hypothetical protein
VARDRLGRIVGAISFSAPRSGARLAQQVWTLAFAFSSSVGLEDLGNSSSEPRSDLELASARSSWILPSTCCARCIAWLTIRSAWISASLISSRASRCESRSSRPRARAQDRLLELALALSPPPAARAAGSSRARTARPRSAATLLDQGRK